MLICTVVIEPIALFHESCPFENTEEPSVGIDIEHNLLTVIES